MRLDSALPMASAYTLASDSFLRIAIRAELSTIISAGPFRRREDPHGRPTYKVLSAACCNLCRLPRAARQGWNHADLVCVPGAPAMLCLPPRSCFHQLAWQAGKNMTEAVTNALRER